MKFLFLSCLTLCFASVAESLIGYAVPFIFAYAANLYTKEVCSNYWTGGSDPSLKYKLSNTLFGQEMAVEALIKALNIHKSSTRPLVLSLHGPPGVGKTKAVEIIVNSLYQKGFQSNFVKQLTPSTKTNYFRSLINEMKDSECSCYTFIFDGIESFDKDFMNDVGKHISGIGSSQPAWNSLRQRCDRGPLYIFISDLGSEEIKKKFIESWTHGKKRTESHYSEYEDIIKSASYETPGGLFNSALIKGHLIDYYIPFLPLERSHVIECINEEKKKLQKFSVSNDEILKEVKFSSDQLPFARGGCKGISKLVKLLS